MHKKGIFAIMHKCMTKNTHVFAGETGKKSRVIHRDETIYVKNAQKASVDEEKKNENNNLV